MRRLLALFFLLMTSAVLMAGVEPFPGADARAIGLGYAYTAVQGQWGCVFFNPAGIAGGTRPEMGVYAERRFGLRELTYAAAGGIYPLGAQQAIGLELRSFGFDAFRQSQIGLAYAITLLDRLTLGVKGKYSSLSIPGYGGAGVLLADVGLSLRLTDELQLGVSAYNVNRGAMQTALGGVEVAPTVLLAGMAYRPTEELLLVAEVSKEETSPANFRGGLEYQVGKLISVRVGAGSEPLLLSGGLGLSWEGLRIDVAYSYTEIFSSPHFGLSYEF